MAGQALSKTDRRGRALVGKIGQRKGYCCVVALEPAFPYLSVRFCLKKFADKWQKWTELLSALVARGDNLAQLQ